MTIYASRRKLMQRILRALRASEPLTITQIAAAVRANQETVKSCVKDMERVYGELVVAGQARTRTGPANLYARSGAGLSAYRQREADWMARANGGDPVLQRVGQWVDRYLAWEREGRPDLGQLTAHRHLYWAVESGLKSMESVEAISLLHVHGAAVWCFGRLDMEEVYRRALDRMARRMEPLFDSLFAGGENRRQPTTGASHEEGQGQEERRRQEAAGVLRT